MIFRVIQVVWGYSCMNFFVYAKAAFCCIQIIYTLLTSKSEQERRLLSALVNKVSPDLILTWSGNFYCYVILLLALLISYSFCLNYIKLGDPEKKGATASNAAYQLTRLVSQSEHPNMRVRHCHSSVFIYINLKSMNCHQQLVDGTCMIYMLFYCYIITIFRSRHPFFFFHSWKISNVLENITCLDFTLKGLLLL